MISLGPLALPAAFLVTVAALWAGWTVSHRSARARALQVEPQLWILLLVGLVAARAAFVLDYGNVHADAPLAVLDLRDGGLRPLAGVLAALLALGVISAWRRALARPLLLGVGTAVAVWLAASTALSLREERVVQMPSLSLPALNGGPVALQQGTLLLEDVDAG